MVKPLPEPAEGGTWKVDKAPKSEIPYVTDGTTKYWCMTVFQQNEEQDKALAASSKPPELDLSRAVQPAKTENTGALESAAMVGLTPRECISQRLRILHHYIHTM